MVLNRMDTTAIIGYSSLALSGASTLYMALNHKRLRSVCCNRHCITSLDIESTSPPKMTLPKANVEPV